jgi:hypothetical protein
METAINQILGDLALYRKTRSTSPIADINDENNISSYFFNMLWPTATTTLVDKYKESFRPSVLIWLLSKYKIKSLLDADVGTGNRLISAILAGKKYIGICNYLPIFENLKYIINSFEYKNANIIKGNFDKIFIGNYTFDMVFLPFKKDVEQIEVCNWIMKAWNNLDIGGILCVYSSNFTPQLESLITTLMKIFTGIDITLSGKYINLYDNNEKICLWRKNKEEQFSLNPHITIKGNIYQTNGVPLIRRGITSYLRCLPRNLHYVANSYTIDLLALYLAQDVPSDKNLTIYINSKQTFLISDIQHLSKENVKVVRYTENSTEKYNSLYDELPDYQYLLLQGLNSSIFESCLVRELKTDLPQEEDHLIEPERIWLDTDYIVLIRALIYIFDKTILIVSHNNIGRNIKEMLNAESRGRVIFHRKQGKQSVSDMIKVNGYEEDKLFL